MTPSSTLPEIQQPIVAQAGSADPMKGFALTLLAMIGAPILTVGVASLGLWWYGDTGWEPSWSSAVSLLLGAALVHWVVYVLVVGVPVARDRFPLVYVGMAVLTGAAMVVGATIKNRQTPLGLTMSGVVIVAFALVYTWSSGSMPLLLVGYALLGGAAGHEIARPSGGERADEPLDSTAA